MNIDQVSVIIDAALMLAAVFAPASVVWIRLAAKTKDELVKVIRLHKAENQEFKELALSENLKQATKILDRQL